MRPRRIRPVALVLGLVLLAGAGSAAAAVLGLPLNGSQVNDDPASGIDPGQSAGLSDVVGGSLAAGGSRVPWATFEQKSGSAQHIFVRAFKNGQWVTQGASLNISPTVEAEAPSIDFAGAGRTVPWDSWYEPNAALGGSKQIFASRFCAAVTAGCVAANTWVPEGQDRGSGVPSLNIHTSKEAENPSVAGGATVPGNAPVPWIVWAEDTGSGKHAIFISRLVGGDHFELFNGGAPLSPTSRDATHPDITFFGNVSYVSWIEARGSGFRGFVGHFENGAFVLDTPEGIALLSPPRRPSLIDFRVPVSSSCTADPFTRDGLACPVAKVNSPFLVFTTSDSPQRLFSQFVIGGPNCVLFPGCNLTIVRRSIDVLIEASLRQSNSVGILVERIVGAKRVHGTKVLVLRPVGRVPLGHHSTGRLKIRWNLKVNGHRLGKGRYLITLRALDSHRNVLGLTKPVIFTINR